MSDPLLPVNQVCNSCCAVQCTTNLSRASESKTTLAAQIAALQARVTALESKVN